MLDVDRIKCQAFQHLTGAHGRYNGRKCQHRKGGGRRNTHLLISYRKVESREIQHNPKEFYQSGYREKQSRKIGRGLGIRTSALEFDKQKLDFEGLSLSIVEITRDRILLLVLSKTIFKEESTEYKERSGWYVFSRLNNKERATARRRKRKEKAIKNRTSCE